MEMMGKWNVLQRVGWNSGNSATRWARSLQDRLLHHRVVQTAVAKRWTVVLLCAAFLLGRANIVGDLGPFAIAFFAAISFLRRDAAGGVAVALAAGSLLSPEPQFFTIAAQLAVFHLLMRALLRYERLETSHAPLLVFLASFTVSLFADITAGQLTWYAVMMTSVEAALGAVLALIFLQALPVVMLPRKPHPLRTEEVVCFMILVASVLTGTVLWMVGPVSLDIALSRFLVLVFAFTGGAAVGATVGVVTGLILSLADLSALPQISVLAFAGLLAGLLKEGGKWASGFGLLLGASILSIYGGDPASLQHSVYATLAAAALFLLIPKSAFRTIAGFVPGTQEHAQTQRDYVRRVRDVTANRVSRFAGVFKQMAKSFGQMTEQNIVLQHEADLERFVDEVSNEACARCFRKKTCWEKDFYKTYKYMTDMLTELEANPAFSKESVRPAWRKACHKTEKVLTIMRRKHAQYRTDQQWSAKIRESRKLVSEQLYGISQVMDDLVKEIRREGQGLFLQEDQIARALENIGLPVLRLDILSLAEGDVEIEIVHNFKRGFDECRKLIAPLLSDMLGETIAVRSERWDDPAPGQTTVRFSSAREFEVETGVACAAKGGGRLSGDSFSTMELGSGKFAVAVSDGMGNGERARQESSDALSILQQMLESGMDERLAIKSVNSVLMLRSPEEVYATVDLAIIDLYSGKTTFLKIGSTPSFLKRGDEVHVISAHNLPIGILKEIEVDSIVLQLEPGDLLVMMTDGVLDAPGHTVNKELWMKRMLSEMDSDSPQEVADRLLAAVIRGSGGHIADDMTIVAARVGKYAPEWSTFRFPQEAEIERPRIVS